jgi:peptide/nickel transport system ATP-binding protein
MSGEKVVQAIPNDVLRVEDLRVYYDTPNGPVKAVDGVSFSLKPGERMGLIGESGSGKTTLGTAIVRLHRPPARIVGGRVLLDGRNLVDVGDQELRQMRLTKIALIPQAAMNSLNPVMRVGEQIIDAIVAHEGRQSRGELNGRVDQILKHVGLLSVVASRFPHQLSLHAAVVLIGHDMGLVAQFADTIGVLYAGQLAEQGPVDEILEAPLHPYTRLLIDSLPGLDEKKELRGIPGLPPALLNLPPGCPFAPRCPFAFDRCRAETPVIQEVQPKRRVACHLYPSHKALPPIPTGATGLAEAQS